MYPPDKYYTKYNDIISYNGYKFLCWRNFSSGYSYDVFYPFFNIDDIITPTNNLETNAIYSITEGKKYEVLGCKRQVNNKGQLCNIMVEIINDNNQRTPYLTSRFKVDKISNVRKKIKKYIKILQ